VQPAPDVRQRRQETFLVNVDRSREGGAMGSWEPRPDGQPDRPHTITTEMVRAVVAVVHRRISRREFIRRGTIAGLSVTAIGAVLAACGDDEDGGSTSEAAATSAAAPATSAAPETSAPATTAPETTAAATSAPAETTAEATSAAADPLEAIKNVVWPLGIDTVDDEHGPYGPGKASELPADYHGDIGDRGIWTWKFADFKADQPYKLAHAEFSSQWDTSKEISARATIIAEQMGCTLDIFDNNFDGDTAIKNADLIIARKYDFALIGQILPPVNQAIYKKLTDAGVGCGFIAVEATDTPQAIFADAGNYRQFFELGVRLGQFAIDNWDGQVDLVILGAQPRAGEYVAQREVGFKAGVQSVLPDLADDVFETIDTTGVLETAQTTTAALLTSKPDAKFILGSGTNDDTAVGMMNAIIAAGKDATAAVAGQGGQASAVAELSKPESVFKVSCFNDLTTYSWPLAMGVYGLMGGTPGAVNQIPNYYVTKETIADFPPQVGAAK
jgi:ribose transport system substrate-binding protein